MAHDWNQALTCKWVWLIAPPLLSLWLALNHCLTYLLVAVFTDIEFGKGADVPDSSDVYSEVPVEVYNLQRLGHHFEYEYEWGDKRAYQLMQQKYLQRHVPLDIPDGYG